MFVTTTARNSDGSFSCALAVVTGSTREIFIGEGRDRFEAHKAANDLYFNRMHREAVARAKRNQGVIQCLTN